MQSENNKEETKEELKKRFEKMSEDERIAFFLDYIVKHPDWAENKIQDENIRRALPGEPGTSMIMYATKANQPKYLYTILKHLPEHRANVVIDRNLKISVIEAFVKNKQPEYLNRFLKEYCSVDDKIEASLIRRLYEHLFLIHPFGKEFHKTVPLEMLHNIDQYLDPNFVMFGKYCSFLENNSQYDISNLIQYLYEKKLSEATNLENKLSEKCKNVSLSIETKSKI